MSKFTDTILRIIATAWMCLVYLVLAVVVLIVIEFVIEIFYPASFETKSTRQAYALFINNPDYRDLPDEVSITLDGKKAVFRKNTDSYTQLVHLLHNGLADNFILRDGKYPEFSYRPKDICGEMVISNFGIPSHFRLVRAETNPDFYWIRLPKLTSPGATFPAFTADPKVTEFIHAQAAESK
jgi:hypothetical protein